MKYTDQISKTVYENIEVEVSDGITYFHTWNEDNEPEYYYRLHIKREGRFETLYNIAVTKVCTYEDNLFVGWREYCESELPYNLRGYFSGQEKMEIITQEQFNKVKQEILNKL